MGPYTTNKDGSISYKGNKIFEAIRDINNITPDLRILEQRVGSFSKDSMWTNIAKINNQINLSVHEYFNSQGSLFTILPLVTRMISSPGAVYGKEKINYTTDTCPVKVKWFNLEREAFLTESSQIYLELALIQKGVDSVYSVYNSIRKEEADATHLSEFHHIEYEGKINQKTNKKIALGLIEKIIKDLLKKNETNLGYFLDDKKLVKLSDLTDKISYLPEITFREALGILYEETKNEKYKKFTMENNFGSWEEIKLTEVFDSMILINEYPLLEVPFYHSTIILPDLDKARIKVDSYHPSLNLFPNLPSSEDKLSIPKERLVADNTDIIWAGYREILGSGQRVKSSRELEEKSQIFNLPVKDYEPYLQSREIPDYTPTSGFGLGWERLVQGLLEMPFIWSASQFPRVDKSLKP